MSDPAESRASEPPPWRKVVIESSPAGSEEIAVFLAELTGRGAEALPSARDGARRRERVIGYLDGPSFAREEEALRTFLRTLQARDPGASPRILDTGPVRREDWQETWKRHFRAARVTPRLAVSPPWEEYAPAAGEKVLVIDPGMAFGTGLHASTRLVLSFIDDHYRKRGTVPNKGDRVLDVGTGTGILAMACSLLGAREVLAVDNDPQALEAARRNVARGGLAERITLAGSELSAIAGTFDLIAANILCDTLASLAPHLKARLNEAGTLLCAGILAGKQQDDLRKIFAGLGLRQTEERIEGEWAALRFRR